LAFSWAGVHFYMGTLETVSTDTLTNNLFYCRNDVLLSRAGDRRSTAASAANALILLAAISFSMGCGNAVHGSKCGRQEPFDYGGCGLLKRLNILHIITGLEDGGAEMMLLKLLSRIDRSAFDNTILSLTDEGVIAHRIREIDIPVKALHLRPGIPNPMYLRPIAQVIRAEKPDLIQTWMYHADLLGGLAAKMVEPIPVIWNIRHADLDPRANKRSTLMTAAACARLSSRIPARIVSCSETACKTHKAYGYDVSRMVVIPNGFDLDDYQPNSLARQSVRTEFGLDPNAFMIGIVGRFHPQKDHRTFLRAASLLHAKYPNVHFVLCGTGVTLDNSQICEWVAEENLGDYCHFLGRREDIPRLTAAFDIGTISSVGEGFPNVIGEAMACSVPCVVTDVGDSAHLVGDTGGVVPSRDPEALADAWAEMIELGDTRLELGRRARKRVDKHFSIGAVTLQYEELYREVAGRPLEVMSRCAA
jgi:glycosyltransferase involved in cell wall biosynthesis